jgi:peptidoglycan hydrolase-like protein with peptidoglycan-binding domain
MKARHLGPFVAFIAIGCTHAKTTDQETATPAKEEAKAPEARDRARPRARPAHRDPSEIPVATSAHGLLTPGAERQIRDKLVARGFMEAPAEGAPPPSLRAPLKRFQNANDLPATGTPDAETIRKLGLDPEAVLRKATGDQADDATDRPPRGVPE